MFENLLAGFTLIFHLQPIMMIFFGVFLGIIIGALPGLTATMGVAIFLPLTFFMAPVPGISFLLGIYCGGIYGGSITAILIKTPGTPAAAATVLDGFTLARNGHALKALQMALYASTISGLVSAASLIFISPPLAQIALRFGPPEYFALGFFGLTIVASVSGGSLIKGLIAASLGIIISFVGLDPVTGSPRLTFGTVTLQSGFNLIPALIGLFALSEVMIQADEGLKQKDQEVLGVSGESLTFRELKSCLVTILRGSLIGIFVGATPATGAAVAAFASYNEAVRTSKRRSEFGKGCLEGVAAAESGNNGVTGATLIPLLTLGIPGDTVTAVLLGALMVQGLTPGPLLFQNKASAEIIFGIFAGLVIANLILLLLGAIGVRFFYRVAKIPGVYLYPTIFSLCCIGAFAVNTQIFDVYAMVGFGFMGYIMHKLKFPVAPVLLALILGPMTESNLRRGLVAAGGNYWNFFMRPITLIVLGLSLASIIFFLRRELRDARRSKGKPLP